MNSNMGAFSRAMLDQVADPNRDVRFEFAVQGGPTISCSCRDFVVVRPEEERLIREWLAGKDKPRVLDIGCGIGRHSALVRRLAPGAEITLVEIDPGLRAYACAEVAGSVGHALLQNLPGDARFDCVFLLGNSLGIFGTEQETRDGLKRIHGLVADGGSVLIESGSPSSGASPPSFRPHAPTSSPTTACSRQPPHGATSSSPSAPPPPPRLRARLSIPTHPQTPAPPPARARPRPSSCAASSSPSTSSPVRIAVAPAA
jgi:SAM-dependent methyltransferase